MLRRFTLALIVALAWAAPRDVAAQPAPPAAAKAPVLVPPSLVGEPEVLYPDGAKGDAVVALLLVVEPDGTVATADVESGDEPFATEAKRAALSFRFQPATRDDKPIRAKIRFSVTFKEPPPPPPPAPPAKTDAPPPAKPKAQKAVVAQTGEIRVVGDRPEPGRSATLSRAEVRQIPGTFGDPFRAVETLPGVTPVVSGLPFFFIRGAPPGNVGYFLDGIRVPLLYHIGVGPSVIHPGLVERVDLYPGGYPAKYGRFAGGIVSGETLAPGQVWRGEFNVRLFDAGALVEAPFAGGRGTALVGGRYSYTAALLTYFAPGVILDYWDYQARLSYRVTRDDTLTAFSFGSYDYLAQDTPTQRLTLFGTDFHRLDLRWDHAMGGDDRMRLAVTGGVDRTRLTEGRYLRDRIVGTRTDVVKRAAPNLLFRFGADMQLDAYDVQLTTGDESGSAQRISNLFPSRTDLAMGFRADAVVGITDRWEVTPGLRVDVFSSDGAAAVGVDPRIASRLQMSTRWALLSAFGIAHQPPAFVLPVPGFQPGGIRGGLQRAVQESLGLEWQIDPSLVATATVFHNGFFAMSDPLSVTPRTANGCQQGDYPTDSLAGDPGNQPTGNGTRCGQPKFKEGTLGPDRSGGGGQAADSQGASNAATAFEKRTAGHAYGLELYVKKRLTSRLGGYFSYTLSRSVRSYENRTFTANFDRTHVMNGALAYNLGRKWRAGTRVTFYTGLPGVSTNADPNPGRLPSFYRVDLRLEKRWDPSPRFWVSAVAEWMNATLSKEAVSTSCTLNGCETQTIGPLTIPSLGVEGGF